MSVAEEWIEENTAYCKRLDSRFSPWFCARYRQDNPVCKGCEQTAEMDRKAEEMKMAKGCLDCGSTEKKIVGRGLCGGCYNRLKKAGTLDEMYPLATLPAEEAVEEPPVKPVVEEEQEATPPPAAEVQLARSINLDIEMGPGRLTFSPGTKRRIVQQVEEAIKKAEKLGCTGEIMTAALGDTLTNLPPNQVLLTFEERDQDLLQALTELAEEDRRTLPAQILCLLEKAVA